MQLMTFHKYIYREAISFACRIEQKWDKLAELTELGSASTSTPLENEHEEKMLLLCKWATKGAYN